MTIVKIMADVAVILRLLLQMQEAGILTVLRIKERFLKAPSAGGAYAFTSVFCGAMYVCMYVCVTCVCLRTAGWRDIMINVRVKGSQHICEIQVAMLWHA